MPHTMRICNQLVALIVLMAYGAPHAQAFWPFASTESKMEGDWTLLVYGGIDPIQVTVKKGAVATKDSGHIFLTYELIGKDSIRIKRRVEGGEREYLLKLRLQEAAGTNSMKWETESKSWGYSFTRKAK